MNLRNTDAIRSHRVWAFGIDMIVVFLLCEMSEIFLRGHVANTLMPLLIGGLYYIVLESYFKHATLGQMFLKLKVVDLEEKMLSPKKSFFRYFSLCLPALPYTIVSLIFFDTYVRSSLGWSNIDGFYSTKLVLGKSVSDEVVSLFVWTYWGSALGFILYAYTLLNSKRIPIHDKISKTKVVSRVI